VENLCLAFQNQPSPPPNSQRRPLQPRAKRSNIWEFLIFWLKCDDFSHQSAALPPALLFQLNPEIQNRLTNASNFFGGCLGRSHVPAKSISGPWLSVVPPLCASEFKKSDFGMFTQIAAVAGAALSPALLSQLQSEILKTALPLPLIFLEGVWEGPMYLQNASAVLGWLWCGRSGPPSSKKVILGW